MAGLTRRCNRCGCTKALDHFSVNRSYSCGLDGRCRDCAREDGRAYSARHPERKKRQRRESAQRKAAQETETEAEQRRAAQRAYGKANRERINARARAWRERNEEKMRAYREKRDQEAVRDYMREYLREWRQQNPSKVKAAYHARRTNASVTSETVAYLEVLRGDPCAYCGSPAGSVDHIEPVAKGGANTWDNLTPACRSCNSSKHTRSLLTFLLAMPLAVQRRRAA